MWISAATPGGSGGTELWINTSSCDHTRAVVSIRDPSRLVVTCRVGGHTLDFCVLHAPSAHPPQRADEWWDKTGSVLRTVFRPTRDRVVMIDANGRLGEAPTLLLERASSPDFDDYGYFLLDFMHDWDMEAPASLEPLPPSTWTRLISSWSLLRGTTWSSGTQSSRACHSHFGVRRIIDLSPPRSPFSHLLFT